MGTALVRVGLGLDPASFLPGIYVWGAVGEQLLDVTY